MALGRGQIQSEVTSQGKSQGSDPFGLNFTVFMVAWLQMATEHLKSGYKCKTCTKFWNFSIKKNVKCHFNNFTLIKNRKGNILDIFNVYIIKY